MKVAPQSALSFETFRACGLCGLVHPLYGVPLVVGPCMSARGAEVRKSGIRDQPQRHQLIARDDPVLSHGPMCPSSFAFALDRVCTSGGRGQGQVAAVCRLTVRERLKGRRQPSMEYSVCGVQLDKMDLIIVRLR
jgi:hypothetical protein